jgi:hypothetical protein
MQLLEGPLRGVPVGTALPHRLPSCHACASSDPECLRALPAR